MPGDAASSAFLSGFDPDTNPRPAVALRLEVAENRSEQPVHRHRKGQLVLALHGGVTCEVPNALWMVPPQCGVWIPGGMPHSNQVTANARICFLFVEPGAADMPSECCTLSLSPLVRELIQYLAAQDQDYAREGPTARLVGVLLDQLATMPVEQLHLPISDHPKVRRIADTLTADPADRTTLAAWAERLAMSERSLARLVLRETGLTFGRWRRQLHLIVALRWLAAGASVQRVANDLGYDSVTAFITMFRKSLGQPPGRYFAALRQP
ncbi:helix-turn-helix transcriptional regulator [Pigmentiphaga soli]|uniref:Helix-turn-helix transcriptional regulator n=1 Tax=Pigmentiphaga soli TaxID=1007095 RepID=A0ABP8HRZ7_9BURK